MFHYFICKVFYFFFYVVTYNSHSESYILNLYCSFNFNRP